MLNKHRGELYLVIGAIFFSMNGVVVTLVLDHMTTFRLAQARAIGAFLLLFIFTFIQDRNSLKAERREIPTLIFYGVFGYAMVQLGYFIGISRGVPLSLVLISNLPLRFGSFSGSNLFVNQSLPKICGLQLHSLYLG